MNRGRKDGNEMKNHEGYYDPTAGKAIRRAARHKIEPVDLSAPGSSGLSGDTEMILKMCT